MKEQVSDEYDKRLKQLRQAYENGILDEDTYQISVAALSAQAKSWGQVAGSGIMARDQGAVSVGKKNITLSDNAQIHGNVYFGPEPKSLGEAKVIYCHVMAHACKHLPLRGVDVGTSDPTSGHKPLCLANVYVDLNTTTRVPVTEAEKKEQKSKGSLLEDQNTRPMSALDAAIENRRLVLLGDPGSGKSTFVNYLAYCLATHILEPNGEWLDHHLPGWPEKEFLPVVVILRDFVHSLSDTLSGRAEPSHLWNFIRERLKAQNLTFTVDLIEQALEDGRVLILLDGLDEVPSCGQRLFVRDAVTAFADRYWRSRFLITCRVLSYQPPATPDALDLRLPLSVFPTFELASFDQEKIDRFIRAWYDELSANAVVCREDAAVLAKQLRFAVSRPDLRRLSPNPLLLTVMALVHTHEGRLPDTRALLYEKTVDILLWRWEQLKASGYGKDPRLRQLLLEAGRSDVDLKRTLGQLAFKAHDRTSREERDQNKLTDISAWELQRSLAGLKSDDHNWARQAIEVMKLRTGLLLERSPDVFTFPHRTFQEYLAGAHLASQADFAKSAARLADQGSLWREVVLLAVGKLVHVSGEVDRPLALVAELCPKQAGNDEGTWRKVWLAMDALLEVGVNRASDRKLGQELLERGRERMADLLNKGRLSARERADIGDSLGRLGDPRVEEGNLKTGPMICISGGSFWMGAQKNSPTEQNFDQDAYDDESPVHPVDLSPYRISKYPITVGQYQRFIEDRGYQNKCYWEAGGFGQFNEPYEWSNQQPYSSCPVRYVSWYEAAAYACWAGGRLPSEAEWERAARGPGREHQKYPWGNADPSPETANFRGSEIKKAAPVGIFPRGCSPEGVFDLAGNVWEWCGDWYSEGYYQLCSQQGIVKDPRWWTEKGEGRVVRGGSFLDGLNDLRCPARLRYFPLNRVNNLGFRVVCDLSSHLSSHQGHDSMKGSRLRPAGRKRGG